MRIGLSLFTTVLVIACHTGSEATRADAAPRASSSAPSASAPSTPSASAGETPAAPSAGAQATEIGDAPSGTCSLSGDERRAMEKCLWSLVSYRVGIRGTFGIRVKMTRDASGAARGSSQVDQEAWRDAPAGTCLATLAQAFADAGKPLPCSWKAKGPYPAWTVSTD